MKEISELEPQELFTVVTNVAQMAAHLDMVHKTMFRTELTLKGCIDTGCNPDAPPALSDQKALPAMVLLTLSVMTLTPALNVNELVTYVRGVHAMMKTLEWEAKQTHD